MRILGIETSCDETSAAIIEGKSGDRKVKLISNMVASSLTLHSKTGGIIPEIAAREQIKYIIPVIKEVLRIRHSGTEAEGRVRLLDKRGKRSQLVGNTHPESPTTIRDSGQARMTEAIDAIAITVGPGLIGSLLVGVETAKTLGYVWKKPIIPVNHLIGHIYANFVGESQKFATEISFPALALIVSGGHTDLVLIKKHGSIKWIGGTRDDAAGEAFDKIGRLLELPYPGGPSIEEAAKNGNPKAFNFPRPMIDSNDFDFSFSGLKTAVFRKTTTIEQLNNETISNVSASVQKAVIDVLIRKTLKAAQKYKVKSILISGGVATNESLREKLRINSLELKVGFFAPPKNLCTDNGAMIASAAFFNYKPVPWYKITPNPELYFD